MPGSSPAMTPSSKLTPSHARVVAVGVALADAAVLAVQHGFRPLASGNGLGLLPGLALRLEGGDRRGRALFLHHPAIILHHHVLVLVHGLPSRTPTTGRERL